MENLSLSLKWSSLLGCDIETVREKVWQRSGIYRLLSRSEDGKFRSFYVGQAENLQERLASHFSASEPNKQLSKILKTKDCRFKFAYVESERERSGAERYLFDLLPDLVNEQRPKADPIEVNLA